MCMVLLVLVHPSDTALLSSKGWFYRNLLPQGRDDYFYWHFTVSSGVTLGCDFLARIRRYTDTQITPAKVFVIAGVLLRICHADVRIFHYQCTDTHTN